MITKFKIFESKKEEKVIYLKELREKYMNEVIVRGDAYQNFDIESMVEELEKYGFREGRYIKWEILQNGEWVNKADLIREREPGRFDNNEYLEIERLEIIDNRILFIVNLAAFVGQADIGFDIAKRHENDGRYNNCRHVDNYRITTVVPKKIISKEDPYGEEDWND